MADKSRFGPVQNQYGKVVDRGVFNKTIIILLGLAGCKMITVNSALRA